jgi:HK97 family phage major capsid protein
VPTAFYDRIMEVARYTGPMLELATIINTASGENLQVPRTNAYSTGSITTEGSTIGESDPTFSAFVTLGAYKFSFLTQISREMIEDSGVDILGYLGTNVGQALGYAVNADLTTGNGSSKPTGVVHAAGSALSGTVTGGVPTYDEIVELYYSLCSSPAWLCFHGQRQDDRCDPQDHKPRWRLRVPARTLRADT